ncbi:type II toxin-antitoxin system HicA family toxin [bacterium]|nr:type II toxin-antitoxin system HicA family toxin [bacterium]
MTYRNVIHALRAVGFVFERQAKGSHEIWRHPETRRYVTVPNHSGTMPVATVRAIIRQTGLTIEKFMKITE